MRRFGYIAPASLDEALEFMAELCPEAAPIAGGTDLLPRIKRSGSAPRWVVDLRCVDDLKYERSEGSRVAFGALTSISAFARSPFLTRQSPLMAVAAGFLGSPQIRNLATVGGNICNAAPSAEMATPLLVLDGEVVMRSVRGSRTMPIGEFFRGPGRTALGPDELVVGLSADAVSPATLTCYLRHTRRAATDIALASTSLRVDLDAAGVIQKARLAVGAVAPTPLRSLAAEELLVGRELTGGHVPRLAAEVADLVVDRTCSPITDVRCTADYRSEMTRLLVRRALEELGRQHVAAGSAGGDDESR